MEGRMKNTEKEFKAMQEIRKKLLGEFNKGVIVDLEKYKENLEYVPFSSVGVNMLLGCKGAPCGRLMEFYGPEGGGKTMLALDLISNAQKMGHICMYVDAECALDADWAIKLGVDMKPEVLTWIQPDNGDEALDIVEKAVRSGIYKVIVFDSVAAATPISEIELNTQDASNRMGLVAKMINVGLRKITAQASKSRTAIIFVNQVRQKMGVTWGDPEDTPGGRALKFYASVRLRISSLTGKKNLILEGEEKVGHRTKVTIKKNKVFPPSAREVEFYLNYYKGIDKISELIDISSELGIDIPKKSILEQDIIMQNAIEVQIYEAYTKKRLEFMNVKKEEGEDE
jgi:recombination protein RecA